MNFGEKIADLVEWFEEAVPQNTCNGEWYQGEELIEKADGIGFYNIELTFHLTDGTALTVDNKVLESWLEERRIGDILEVEEDCVANVSADWIIPFSAIAYISNTTRDIDWQAEIAKKEQREIKAQLRIGFDGPMEVQELWHSSDEIPEGGGNRHVLIQYECKTPYFSVYRVDEFKDWKGFTSKIFIRRWRYIEDILPKEGGEQ